MHDTLIHGCVSVSALLEAYTSLGKSESAAKTDLLDCARTHLRSAIDEARQAVWDLRQSPESMANIDPLLARMSEQVSHEFSVPVSYQMLGRPYDLDQSTVHELLMVAREALYNSARHGRPRQVQLYLSFDENGCTLQVQDDGIGFDPKTLPRSDGHYGLLGMKERVERLRGKFSLESRLGGGTDLTVQVPRKSALPATKVPEMTL
jgi:signal transduction histidine kinase